MGLAVVVLTLLSPTATTEAETYQYDEAGRLTQVLYEDGTAIRYSYDANSNILSARVLGDALFMDGFE